MWTRSKKAIKDGSVKPQDESINLQIEDALIRRLDEFQEEIEIDSTLSGNDKKKYLRGLEYMLRGFNQNWSKKDYSPSQGPALLDAYIKAMELDRQHKSIQPVITENQWGVGKILVECFLLPSENSGVQPSRIELMGKYMTIHPEEILPTPSRNADLPLADSLIVVVAHNDPDRLYDYAQGGGLSSDQNHKDPLVKAIAQMAMQSGQMYFPFLDNIVKGKISFLLDSVKNNDFAYYRLLVKQDLISVQQTMELKQPIWAMDAIWTGCYWPRSILFTDLRFMCRRMKISGLRVEGLTPGIILFVCTG
jgi:hypothetical protein